MHRRRLLTASIIISVFGILSYQAFETFLHRVPLWRDLLFFAGLAFVAFIGFWGWKYIAWAQRVWILAYGLAILILLLAGVTNRFISEIPDYLKKDSSHLRTLFMSPMPFAILYLFTSLRKSPP